MSFRILSHASMLVDYNSSSLLIDPWLTGSCYWRSWWNYPPVNKESVKDLKPDAIYITHVHWDHWHGPTLRRFLKQDIQIITHDEPNKRSYRDLNKFGFKNIKVLKHGESHSIGDITITPYQFGLFLNDSAVVVETPDIKILNANDCKIAGAALDQIKKKHGHFDFAMRSHSSANDRVCYSIEGSDKMFDDPDHYTRAFKLFMDNVKPSYAIPFASNHCHLHRDVYDMNHIINDPYRLRRDLNNCGGLEESDLVIMLSGDSWSKNGGFEIDAGKKKFFEDKEKWLAEYQESESQVLDKYYKRQKRAKVTPRILTKFEGFLRAIPKFSKRRLAGWDFALKIVGGAAEYFILVTPCKDRAVFVDEDIFENSESKIVMPVDIFNSAVNLNMFHHSGISKRNKYLFTNEENLLKWELMNGFLEKIELEVYPLRISYLLNLTRNYIRRWREIYVYFQAFILTRKGVKIYDVEEKILSGGVK